MSAKVLSPGDVFRDHEVVRLLGAGGFAQVYEVQDRSGARRALKVLDADAEARPKMRARLAQEGSALALIEHVNVVRLYDAGTDGDRVYLLLELVHGRNLRQALAEHGKRPPVGTALRWIRQAAQGVAEAHRLGVIHRDLKPENLLVTPDEVVKVIDFGIAKLTGWGVKTSHEQRVGTALYMSPEHIQGKTPDPRMDVYALGVILYEALTGRHPLVNEAATVFQICALQLGTRPRPLAEVAPGLPLELGELVDRALEKDPERRVPSMAALAEGIGSVMLQVSAVRVAQLRDLVSAQAITAPVAPAALAAATTEVPTGGERASSATPLPAVTRASQHLIRTEVLPTTGQVAFAPTVPVPHASQVVPITAPMQAAPVQAAPVYAPPPSMPASSVTAMTSRRPPWGVLAVVVIAVVLGVAGGVWIGTRLF